MNNIFTKVAIAAVLGLSTLAAIPATASARDTSIYIGVSGHRHHETYYHHHNPRHDRRGYRESCSSGQAEYKASRFGLRAAHVIRRTPGRVVVEGRRHHYHQRIVFANTRGCPIIR